MFLVFQGYLWLPAFVSGDTSSLEELINSINFFLLRPELHIAMQVKGFVQFVNEQK